MPARVFLTGVCACLMASLPGCAVTSPLTTTQINGTRVELVSTVDLPDPEEGLTQASQLHAALVKELGRRNVSLASDANVVGQMSYSASPVSIGIYSNQSTKPASEAIAIAEAQESHWYDRCKAVRVRASLALFARDSGQALSSSSAQTTICEDGAVDHDEVARLLIDSVLAF